MRVWDVAGKVAPRVLLGHARAVEWLSASRDGVHVASGGSDREVRVWNLETGEGRVLGSKDRLGRGTFSRSGTFLATGGEGMVRVWDMRAPPETVLRGHTDVIEAVTWFPDGARLSRTPARRTRPSACGMQRPERPSPCSRGARPAVPLGARLDPAGRADRHGGRRLQAGHLGRRLVEAGARSRQRSRRQFTPDRRRRPLSLVTGGEDGLLRVWDSTTGDARVLPSHQAAITHLEISPDRAMIASASADGHIRLLDFATGDVRAVLEMNASVSRARFSPNGALLAGSSREGQVRVWSPKSGALLLDLKGYRANLLRLQFTPDSKGLVFAGSGGAIRICDLATGAVRVLEGHTGLVRGIDLSPDGSLVASVGIDGTARLWDFATGRLRALRRSSEPMTRVAFSPDGHSLAVAGGALVHIYPIRPEASPRPARRTRLPAPGSLTSQQR